MRIWPPKSRSILGQGDFCWISSRFPAELWEDVHPRRHVPCEETSGTSRLMISMLKAQCSSPFLIHKCKKLWNKYLAYHERSSEYAYHLEYSWSLLGSDSCELTIHFFKQTIFWFLHVAQIAFQYITGHQLSFDLNSLLLLRLYLGFEVIVGEGGDFGTSKMIRLEDDSIHVLFERGEPKRPVFLEARNCWFVSGRVPGKLSAWAKCQKDKQENINPRHFSTLSAFNVFTT